MTSRLREILDRGITPSGYVVDRRLIVKDARRVLSEASAFALKQHRAVQKYLRGGKAV